MKIDFTNEMVFSFPGPTLCLLGNEQDFQRLAQAIVILTNRLQETSFELHALDFMENEGEDKRIIFSSKADARQLAILNENEDLIFELSHNVWERLFKFFVLMSWNKSTYYLNAEENHLDDLRLKQDVNFVCSSSF